MKKNTNPPKILEAMLRLFLNDSTMYSAHGDYAELYEHISQEKGRISALVWYVFQILKQFTAYCTNYYIWSLVMFNNYLKTTIRYIRRHKMYSIINISGLAIGMACFIMILFYVNYELSYDRYHKKSDSIYRVLVHNKLGFMESDKWAWTPSAMAPVFKETFPGIVNAARVEDFPEPIFSYKGKVFSEKKLFLADPEFLEIFSFELLKGDPKTALDEPFSLLLTQTEAFKYFGNENPIGEVIQVNNTFNFTVTGVMKEVPENSHFTFGLLGSFESLRSIYGEKEMNRWGSSNYMTYLQLSENTNLSDLEEVLTKFTNDNMTFSVPRIELQPLTDIHLGGNIPGEFGKNSEKKYVYIFSLIGIFILIITSCNYMNLATARSAKRTMEVGVRKVIGASRGQLIKQFFGESMVFVWIAFMISLLLVYLTLPIFNSIIDRNLSVEEFFSIPMFFSLIGLTVLIGLSSGAYPAFFISSFKPVAAIKGSGKAGSKGSLFFRNSLVIVQFIISITLGVSTIVAYRQMDYITTKDAGFRKDQIANIGISHQNMKIRDNGDVLVNTLKTIPGIESASISNYTPTDIRAGDFASWEGMAEGGGALFHNLRVDYDYLDLYDIEILQGRNFSRDIGSDLEQGLIVNETAVKIMGFEDPIGKTFSNGNKKGKIIGVVKDFHFMPMMVKIVPLAVTLNFNSRAWLSVRLNSNDFKRTLTSIEEKWTEFSPGFPMNYSFIDERFDAIYKEDMRQSAIFGYFASIAVFLACLGLFGLASFTVEQKTKEIGVRKVLGASSGRIVMLISSEFIKWVLLASFVAIPLAWYAMSNWISNYAYRINIGFDIFLSGIVLALLIVIISVSFQAAKAANSNPVESLRYE